MEGNPANSLIPFATVAAALIAGFFSFLNLVISKEQKVSEFRQAWIDKLREDISSIVASNRSLANLNQVATEIGQHKDLEHHKAMQSTVMSGAQNYTSIVLRINPLDSDGKVRQLNKDFLFTLTSMRDAVRANKYDEARDIGDTLSDRAQPILKYEWERVKKGEPIYRWSLRLAAGIVVIALLAGSFLVYRTLYNSPRQELAPANEPAKPAQQGQTDFSKPSPKP